MDKKDSCLAYSTTDAVTVDWTVGDLLRRVAQEVPDQVALTYLRDNSRKTKNSWTYSELLSRSEAFAGYLRQHFEPGEHIAIWATNRPEWLFFQFGTALAGLVLVTVNPAARDEDFSHIVSQSDAVGLFHGTPLPDVERTRLLDLVQNRCPRLRHIEALDQAYARSGDCEPKDKLATTDPLSPAIILFTSGTTGKAKGALLSHRSIVNGQQFFERRLNLSRGSKWLNPTPLYTIAGSIFVNLGALWNRGTHILLERFHPELVMRGIEDEGANWAPLVPTMATMLLEYVQNRSHDFRSLKAVTMAGSPIAPELARQLEGVTGAMVCGAFGQTEAGATITHCDRADSLFLRTTTAGQVLPGREIRIVDTASGQTLACDKVGEICVRGLTMTGYHNMQEATATALDRDGWLHTGDLGKLTQGGYLTITGRLKDMIIRGGLNIYPREIEDWLVEHPAIVEAAVFGTPDAKWGESVVAAIRLREGCTDPGSEAIKEFLASRIADNKIPSVIYNVLEFPLTASGKIQKFALRDKFLQQSSISGSGKS